MFATTTDQKIGYDMQELSKKIQLFGINGCAVTALHTVRAGKTNLESLTKGMCFMKIVADSRAYSHRLVLAN